MVTRTPIRWIYHLVAGTSESVNRLVTDSARFAPASLLKEKFIHGSFLPDLRTSGELYFPPDSELWAVPIDPRRVDVPIEIALTPRGPMPHLFGSISRDALGTPIALTTLGDATDATDAVMGTRIAMVTRGSAGVPSAATVAAKEPETFDGSRLGESLAGRFGARIALIPVDVDHTEARNTDFDALLFVDPAARSWASGLPRNRRVFTASARIAEEIDKWLTFAAAAVPTAPASQPL